MSLDLIDINPEQVAFWFFRLNGCATIVNFVVHPDRRAPSRRNNVDNKYQNIWDSIRENT